MTEPRDPDEDVAFELQAMVHRHYGRPILITSYVVLIEAVEADGEPCTIRLVAPRQRLRVTLGMLDAGAAIERRMIVDEWMADEEHDDE